MKNLRIKKLSAVISLVLVLTLVLGTMAIPAFAAEDQSESDKLVEIFYDKTIHEYYDDVYAAIYNYVVDQGLIIDAIAAIDEMIAAVEEYRAQIPEAPEMPEDPEEIPEEIPEDVWAEVPEVLDQLPPEMIEQLPPAVIEQVPADTIVQIKNEHPGLLEKIPDSVLDQIPQDTIDQLPDDLRAEIMGRLENYNGVVNAPVQPAVFTLRARATTNAYTEYVNYLNQLKQECDDLLATLVELKAILAGDDLNTWEGLVETVHYLEEELPVRIQSIKLTWAVLAGYVIEGVPFYNEETDPEQVREDLLAGIDALVKLENAINNDVIPAIDAALKALADIAYDPACTLFEIFLDKEIGTADELVNAMEIVAGMTKEEIKTRVYEILHDATHNDYEVDADSLYLAFGNIYARDSYVEVLAEMLGVAHLDKTNKDDSIEDFAGKVNDYAEDIKKADLITLNFGEVASLVEIAQNVYDAESDFRVDWETYMGSKAAEVEAKIKELLDKAYAELDKNGVNGDQAESIVSAIEQYAFKYVVYAVNVEKAAKQIAAINPDAMIVVIGAYNPVSEMTYTVGDTTIELGAYIDYLFDAFGVYDLAYAIVTEDFTYVDAPDVDVLLDEMVLSTELLAQLTLNNLMPSPEGHAYIAGQVYNAISNWTVVEKPDCVNPGLAERYCDKCGVTETKVLDPLGHIWGEWTVKSEATKDSPCIEHRFCERCGEEETRTVGGPADTGDLFGAIVILTITSGAALYLLTSKRKYFI